jgi:hypothetical protein
MRAPRSIVLACLTAGAGCATTLPCPARGGPPWRELTSDHFRLRTDLDPADAEQTVRALEESRAVMLAVVWPGSPQPPNRTDVIVLRSTLDLWEFTGTRLVAGRWVERRPFPGTLVTAGPPEPGVLRTVAHEVAHDLSTWYVPLQPRWYAEGLATYLETATYDRVRKRARMGEPSAERMLTLLRRRSFPARELLAVQALPAGVDGARFEASAWLLVHYLMNHRSAAFARLQGRLNALARPADAWAAEMPDLPPDRLQTELLQYFASGRYTVDELPMEPPTATVRTRVLPDAEVHGVYAFLYASAIDPQRERVREQVAEALAGDAGSLDGLAVSFYLLSGNGDPARGELARRATAAHPESWLAWTMVADAAGPDATSRRTALARALALSPSQPQVLVRQALLDGAQGRWREAVVFTTRALRNRSAEPGLYLTHVQALAHTGYCREGAALAEALPALLPAALAQEVGRGWASLAAECARVRAAREAADAEAQHP